MSSITTSSDSAEVTTICTYSRCWRLSSVSSSSSDMPMTLFIGVRISWLMLARNSLFAFEALVSCWLVSANSLACARIRWSRSASVITIDWKASARMPTSSRTPSSTVTWAPRSRARTLSARPIRRRTSSRRSTSTRIPHTPSEMATAKSAIRRTSAA